MKHDAPKLKDLKAIIKKERVVIGRDISIFQFSTIFHRPVSIYFTRLFLMAGLTPNTVTILSYLVLAIAGVFFIFGNYWYSLIGLAIYQLFLILDCSDGDMSRYLYGVNKNPWGAFLEYFGHSLFQPFIIICLTFGVYNNPQSILIGSVFYQNLIIMIIGFAGSNLFLALHVLDGLSKVPSSEALSTGSSPPPMKNNGWLQYPLGVLSRVRSFTQKYFFADFLLLVAAVSNALWLYLIVWDLIHLPLVVTNGIVFYRSLPWPKLRE